MTSSFRTAFVVQDRDYDFSDLLQMCDGIKFICTGREAEDQLQEIIAARLEDFDPAMDLLVPVGNILNNLIVGTLLPDLCRDLKFIPIAIYEGRQYHIRMLNLPEREHHE